MSSNKKINVKERYTDGEIDLSMSDLSDVPVRDILALKKVVSLDVSNNRLNTLPKNFASLTFLTKLDLSKNELTQLPDDFGNLTKLRYLDLYQNQLTHLPLSFHKLKDLKFLDLKDNPLVPTVAKVAGLCLDTKQCQSCAKEVVNFFTKLQEQVDNEVEIRTRNRQKQLELNQKKKEEEKKNKKKEKQKQNKEATENRKNNAKPSKVAEVNLQKEVKKQPKKIKKPKHKERSWWGYLMVLTVVALFCTTSINWTYTQFVQKTVVDFYANGLKKIPESIWKEKLIQIANFVNYSHAKTGEYILKAVDHLSSIEAVKNTGELVLNLVKYSVHKTIEIYRSIVK